MAGDREDIRHGNVDGFEPMGVIDIEVGRPLPELTGASAGGPRRVRALVKLHDRPLMEADLDVGEHGRAADEVAEEVWRLAAPAVVDHLRQDGLGPVEGLGAAGIAAAGMPRCRLHRRAVMAAAPMATVVVATRDRPQSLSQCLDSILSLEYPAFEVVVVDNDPSTAEAAGVVAERTAAGANVRYVLEQRRGLAAAHNRGLAEATGSIIAFTDDDVVVDRHWLAAIAEGFSVSPDVGCVTGLIVPAELRTPAQLWVEEYGFSKGFARRLYDMAANRPPDPLFPFTAGRFGSGANMAFRADVLAAIGGFDPAVGTGTLARGGDDLVSFFRIVTGGWALAYEPSAIVRHRHRDDYASLRRQAYGYGVGLTAFLASSLSTQPRQLPKLLARIPAGLSYGRTLRSPDANGSSYPRALTWVERRGMAVGPFAYAASRWQGRRSPTLLVGA